MGGAQHVGVGRGRTRRSGISVTRFNFRLVGRIRDTWGRAHGEGARGSGRPRRRLVRVPR